MNYLEIVNRVRLDCGVSRDDLTTLSNVVDEDRRISGYVSQAWLEIQERHDDWEWMRFPFSFQTVAGQRSYTAAEVGITSFGKYRNRSFKIYLTSAGINTETPLPHEINYDTFRSYWLLGARTTVYARPSVVCIDPSKNLVLALAPNDIYTVSGEYYSCPILLSADTDTPAMPARFHMAIAYRAMKRYGMYEAATELIEEGGSQYAEIMERLEGNQLPQVMQAPGLI
jgi:hypothetical protein